MNAQPCFPGPCLSWMVLSQEVTWSDVDLDQSDESVENRLQESSDGHGETSSVIVLSIQMTHDSGSDEEERAMEVARSDSTLYLSRR